MDTDPARASSLPGRPPRRSRIWLAVATPITIVMLAFVTYQVAGVIAHEETTTVRVVRDPAIRTVEIRNGAGSVEVVGAPVDAITVRAKVSQSLRHAGVSQRIEGDTLVLRGTCPNLGSVWCDVDYHLEVPAGMRVTVRGEDAVVVRDLTGTVDARTDSGSVDASGLRGRAHLQATDGSVRATGIAAEVVEVRSTNGSVRLAMVAVPRSVVAVTVNGSAEVFVPRGDAAYAVDVDTVNGSRTNEVHSDPTAARRITARSTNGSAAVRYGS